MSNARNIASGAKFVDTAGDTMTGDLTVDTNTFHVDVADNRVGIGTSTPDMGKLQINEDAAASTAIFIRNRHNVAGTHSDITFGYGEASNSYGAGIRFRQVDTTHGGQIELYTDNASGAYTKQMQITENGHVTMPNQPAFAATRNAGDVGTGQTYVYNNLYFNRGNHYNSSNGRFTAPVAGVYSVHTNHMDISGAAHTNLYYNILKNGSAYQHVYGTNPTAGTHHRWSWSGIIEMAVNDYLTIYTANMSLYGGGNGYTNFSAALLG